MAGFRGLLHTLAKLMGDFKTWRLQLERLFPDTRRTSRVGHQLPHPGIVRIDVALLQPLLRRGHIFIFELVHYSVLRLPSNDLPAAAANAPRYFFVVGHVDTTVPLVPFGLVFRGYAHPAYLQRRGHV